MPVYTVTDPNTGTKLSLTGDSPPTEAELNQIFAAHGGAPAPKAPPPPAPKPNTYADMIKSAGSGLAQFGNSLVQPALSMTGPLYNAIESGFNKLRSPQEQAPTIPQGSLPKAVTHATGADYVPQTMPGKYVQAIAAMAPAAALPGGVITRTARVVGPGATSELGGEAAQAAGLGGTGWETGARIGGALVGGAAATAGLRSINALAIGRGLPPVIDPNVTAAEKLRAAVGSDGGTGRVGANAIDWANSGASGPALVDVAGSNVRRLVRAAAGGGTGEAQNIAGDYASRVRANFQDRVLDHTRGLTPRNGASATSYAEQLQAGQRTLANRDYGAVRNEPVPLNRDALVALRGRPGQDAIAKSMAEAEIHNDSETVAELQQLQHADLDQIPTIRAGTLDALQRTMGNMGADSSVTPGGRYAGAGYFGRRAGINSALDAAPGLAPARANFAQMQASRDAVDVGGGVLSEPSTSYAEQVAALTGRGGPPNVGGPLQVGARQALVNKLETGADGATGAARTISQASRATDNLNATFGPTRAARYQAAVGNEVRRVGNADFISPNTGSQTATRMDDAGNLMAVPSVPHSLPALAIRVYDTIRGHGAPLTEGERAAIVRMGTTEADLRNLVRANPNLSRAAIAQLAANNTSQRP